MGVIYMIVPNLHLSLYIDDPTHMVWETPGARNVMHYCCLCLFSLETCCSSSIADSAIPLQTLKIIHVIFNFWTI